MRVFIRGAFGVVLFVCLAEVAAAVDYGRTPGSFGVSGGNATYSIPIWTPPGPGGVAPNIALSYNSSGANGVGGVGWHLSAVSSIERCSRTNSQDGNGAAVDLTLLDRYCIGGNRLRLSSGSYGAASSVYFTEIADYSRITAYGSAGNGPQYFVVEAKSGIKYEYGVTTSSRVVLGTTVLRWMLNKVYDRNGNNYVVTYNNATGFAVPDVISWTPTYLGSPSYRYEAKFNYLTTRVDEDSYIGKVAGYDVANRYRLETVQIKSAGAVVRKYRFAYDTSSATSRSRLASAKECADDAESNCFLPLTFGYQAGQAGISGTPLSGLSSASSLRQGKFDFNGDGKSDLMYLSGSTWKVSFSTGSGFSAAVDTGIASAATFFVSRFLANHQDGILVNVSSVWNYVGYTGSSFATTSTGIPVPTGMTGGQEVRPTDNNGDGIADLLWAVGGSIKIRLNTSVAGATVPNFGSEAIPISFSVGQGNVAIINAQNCPVDRTCDVNGDARADLIVNVTSVTGCGIGGCVITSNVYDLLSSGGGFIAGPPTGPIGYRGFKFNDDRCIDRLPNSTAYLQVSGCNNGAPVVLALPSTPVLAVDWNGDGKGDLLVNNAGFFGVYLSKGNVAAPFSSLVTTTIPFSTSCSYFAFDADGDGLDDIACVGTASPYAVSYYLHNGSGGIYLTQQPDLLNSIVDGYGVSISPSYVSTSQNNYVRGTGTQLPLVDSTDPVTVVAQFIASNGIGSTYTKTYSYVGARQNTARGEIAGFQRIDEVDSRSGIITRTTFDQTFPITGMQKQEELMQPNGITPMRRTDFVNSYATLDATPNNQRYFPFNQSSTLTQFETAGPWNGNLLRTVATSNTYDNSSGARYDQTVTTTEPASGANGLTAGGSWSERTYSPLANLVNDITNWCIGRPGQMQQINSHNLTYGGSITRTTTTTWNSSLCRPTQVVDEPGSSTQVTTDLGYDGFGNVNSTTVTGVGMTPRVTATTFSDATYTTGQFQLSTTNALAQTSTYAWNYDVGVPTSASDANGISTSWQYDAFGRRKREDRPDGTASTWSITSCSAVSGGCVGGNNKSVVIQTALAAGGAYVNDQWTYLDAFERQIITTMRTASGSYNRVDREYDSMGRVYRETAPCIWATCTQYWTTSTYDLASRPVTSTRPRSDSDSTPQSTTVSYEGLTTRTTDAQSKQTISVRNAASQLRQSRDHDGYYQTFEYDPFGNVRAISDSAGNTLQGSTFNVRGVLTQRVDMDLGTWNFTPNALGEVVSQTDAKGQTSTFVFDLLGRPTGRTEAEGTSTWTWGNSSAAKNIGRLASVSGPGYSESYTYDSTGRPATTTVNSDTNYQIDYSYNSLGAIDTLTYPTSTSSYRLKLQYEYLYGQLYRIKDYNAASTVFWAASAVNGRNQITQETLGNGLVTNRTFDGVTGSVKAVQTGVGGGTGLQNLAFEWDLAGNLKKRKDLNQSSLTEEFFYDNVYRLDYSQLNGLLNLDMGYDALGNITTKSDVGTYTYHATRKHQVVSTSNGWGFSYDSNGNMITGRGATITWTSYNYPSQISNAGLNSSFYYTPDRQYYKQVADYSNGTATTMYVAGLLEKVTTTSGTDYRHMIRAGGSTIIVSRQTSGINTTHYVTSDHLGSSSAITNSSGAMLVNSSFDAFGKRRGSNWTGTPSAGDWTAIAGTTRRGYTEHSMLDNLNLIHMNGRVQDPLLGRFISADPYVTEPRWTQNYNRYSYLYNNPLSFKDPSGFGCEDSNGSSSSSSTSDDDDDSDGYKNGSSEAAGAAADCMEEIEVTGRREHRPTNDPPKEQPNNQPTRVEEAAARTSGLGSKTQEAAGNKPDPCNVNGAAPTKDQGVVTFENRRNRPIDVQYGDKSVRVLPNFRSFPDSVSPGQVPLHVTDGGGYDIKGNLNVDAGNYYDITVNSNADSQQFRDLTPAQQDFATRRLGQTEFFGVDKENLFPPPIKYDVDGPGDKLDTQGEAGTKGKCEKQAEGQGE
jgi:RHS repeat-associated protein